MHKNVVQPLNTNTTFLYFNAKFTDSCSMNMLRLQCSNCFDLKFKQYNALI